MTRPDWPFAAFGQPFGKQLPPPPVNLQVKQEGGGSMHVARLRRIDGTSAGADVRIGAAAAAEAAPSARPRPRQSTNGSASSAVRARADATFANLTSAIAEIDWSTEVGQTVEVKGGWRLGGTSAQRRNYHLVRVVAHCAAHEFLVQRKHHPSTKRTAPALRIRLVAREGEEEDVDDDAWMDADQYNVYKIRMDKKREEDRVMEIARQALVGLDDDSDSGADADSAGAVATANGEGGAGGGGGACARKRAGKKNRSKRYQSVVKRLFVDLNQYQEAGTGRTGKWAFKCILDGSVQWQPSVKNKKPNSTGRLAKWIRCVIVRRACGPSVL